MSKEKNPALKLTSAMRSRVRAPSDLDLEQQT